MTNVCFICDHPAKPLSGKGNVSFSQKINIFQKLNIKISNQETDFGDVICANCNVILDEIDALRNEINLLSYLVHRQIARKYKAAYRSPDEQPNLYLLNKLDLMAVKSFKLLSNDYVCVKCSFRTQFPDTLVPHYKFHAISEKLPKSWTVNDTVASQESIVNSLESTVDSEASTVVCEDETVECEDDLIEYDSDYEDELNDNNVIVAEINKPGEKDKIEAESVKYTEIAPPESLNTELEFMCPWCPFKDVEYDILTQHMNEMHSDDENKEFSSCANCGCLLEPNGSCSHQKAIDKGFKPKQCTRCHDQFYMDHLLRDHIRRIHLKCDICEKTFSNFKTLRQHEYVHRAGATYKCSDCDKIFKTRTGLIYHLPKHTGNYLYYCNVCSKGFMSEKFLEEHTAIHTKIHKYVCDICGTKFIHNSTYRLHRVWHDNPFPYECTECGQKFNHTSKLAVHRRREHTGDRPYECDVCKKSFFESTSLRIHQRIHAQTVTYKCNICNVSFNSKTEHIQHNQKHHSRNSNLPTKSPCEYKMVLKPEYIAHHKIEAAESLKSNDGSNIDESFQNIEVVSSDNSKLDDRRIYEILFL